MTQPHTLTGGFQDAPRDAARAFRQVMEAMARPGQIHTLKGATPPPPLSAAAGTLLLTLCDPETPIFLAGACDDAQLRQWLAFHCGVPLTGPEQASFAIGTWEALQPLSRFAIGTPQYPDRSATLIVECDTLSNDGPKLTGPGIKDSARLSLPDGGAAALARNHAHFPLGLDLFLTAKDRVAGLPRSTHIAMEDA